MSNIHVEYTSGIFHKNMKNIYMHYGRVMRGVVNIVYFFRLGACTPSGQKIFHLQAFFFWGEGSRGISPIRFARSLMLVTIECL